jgi:hypothetical protein
MNELGENLAVDGMFGPRTMVAMEKFDFDVKVTVSQKSEPPPPEKQPPPWYSFGLRFKGKKETDPEFSKVMVPQWRLFGMNLGTIATNWAAWCGLAMAVTLAGVGVHYSKDGALARNWRTYGIEVVWRQDGIPQGAIVFLNHNADCNSSTSNHVTQANGDCTPEELKTSGAAFDGYGGNQGNEWKVSSYPVAHICAVRWPEDVRYPKPGRLTRSVKCSTLKPNKESTQ